VTSSLLSPRVKRGPTRASEDVPGSAAATRVLDWNSARVQTWAARLTREEAESDLELIRRAHRAVADVIRPVYALDDIQPVSRTIRRGRGSCSQRLAVLEAIARRNGIATRVRGIAVDGTFWYPRFPRLHWLVPDRVVLAWPEFHLEKTWVPVSSLFGSLGEMATGATGYKNSDGETLFDAISRTAVDWDGACGTSSCDLSANVVEELGYYNDRGDLFRERGQTLCWLARKAADPLMSWRRSGR
jgi:hypothetical protein